MGILIPRVNFRNNRLNYTWTDTEESAKQYMQDLLETKNEIELIKNTWGYANILWGNDKLLEETIRGINAELDYCNFYFEYKKAQEDTNFNKWTCSSDELTGRAQGMFENTTIVWTKTNGKLKATIKAEKTGPTTKVTVNIQNDSQYLKFISAPYGGTRNLAKPTHLKSEKSIEERIVTLQQDVDRYLEQHIRPLIKESEELIEQKLLWLAK